MQQQVYQVHEVDELKQCLIDVWHSFERSQCQCHCQSWIYIADKRKASNALKCHQCVKV